MYRLHPAFAFTLTLILTRLLLLSQRHRSLVDGWQKHKLECRVLCDQLFLNAAARRERLCVRELGPAFNYVGSELRRPAGKRAVLPPARRRLPRPAPGPASSPHHTPADDGKPACALGLFRGGAMVGAGIGPDEEEDEFDPSASPSTSTFT